MRYVVLGGPVGFAEPLNITVLDTATAANDGVVASMEINFGEALNQEDAAYVAAVDAVRGGAPVFQVMDSYTSASDLYVYGASLDDAVAFFVANPRAWNANPPSVLVATEVFGQNIVPNIFSDVAQPESGDPEPAAPSASALATLMLRGRFATWAAANTSIQDAASGITYDGGEVPTGTFAGWSTLRDPAPTGTDQMFIAVATAHVGADGQWRIANWVVMPASNSYHVQFSNDGGATWQASQPADATHLRFRLADGQWGSAVPIATEASTAPMQIGDLTATFNSDDPANAQDLALMADSVDLSAFRYLYFRYQGLDGDTVKTTVSRLFPVSMIFAKDYASANPGALAAFHENHTIRIDCRQLYGGNVTRVSGVNHNLPLSSYDNVFHITPGKFASDGTRVIRKLPVFRRQRAQRGRLTLFGVA